MLAPMRFAILMTAAIAFPAAADAPIDANEFDALTRGKTLTYSSNGFDFGAEEYLEDRRVRWTFLDGECFDGTWYESGELICFAYEGFTEDQCWTFQSGPGGLVAQFENDPSSRPVYQTRESREPLLCLGPKVGA